MLEVNQKLALAHAAREFPREACGLLVIRKGREAYVPCRNIGVGTDQFVVHPEDYVRADQLGEIVGVFHSHPNLPAEPSQADKVACEATALPWFIVSFPAGCWAELHPQGYAAPLVGREWAHGVLDCYSLIRDWYRQERGIDLPDFTRFDEWWRRGENLYLDNFSGAGFHVVESSDMNPGDERGVGYRVLAGRDALSLDRLHEPSGQQRITIAPVVSGAGGNGLGQILLGAALIAVSWWNPMGWAAAGSFLSQATLYSVGTSMILGGVAQMIAPTAKAQDPSERPENQPSYVFNGAVNTTAQGHPVPVVYGRLIVGSAVISAGIDVDEIPI